MVLESTQHKRTEYNLKPNTYYLATPFLQKGEWLTCLITLSVKGKNWIYRLPLKFLFEHCYCSLRLLYTLDS